MESSKRPHLIVMLEAAKPTLDRIFGADAYSIERTGEFSAIVHTDVADFEFTDDPRDFVAASIIAIPNVPTVESPIDTWMSFVDYQAPARSRAASYGEQMQAELKSIGIVVNQILSDPAKTRDAACFVRGYNRAYNDWASRKGTWTSICFR